MTLDSDEVIVVKTFAFLTEVSDESTNRILDLSDFKSRGNCEKLVAIGCLTQKYQDNLAEQIPELDGWLGSNGFQKDTGTNKFYVQKFWILTSIFEAKFPLQEI